jgi:hypothetical protein
MTTERKSDHPRALSIAARLKHQLDRPQDNRHWQTERTEDRRALRDEIALVAEESGIPFTKIDLNVGGNFDGLVLKFQADRLVAVQLGPDGTVKVRLGGHLSIIEGTTEAQTTTELHLRWEKHRGWVTDIEDQGPVLGLPGQIPTLHPVDAIWMAIEDAKKAAGW